MDAATTRKRFTDSGCEVRFDGIARQLYATDASIYRIEPLGVAFPKSAEETAAVMRLAAELGVPLTARGAGTGLAGGAVGEGLVVDLARHHRKILGYDRDRHTVRVGAGVVLDQLNDFLKLHGRVFGPDVATSSRATLGGMIANNSSGARAPLYRTTADHLVSLDVVLADGRITTVAPGTEQDLAAAVNAIIAPKTAAIHDRFPGGLCKRWPGYGFDRYLEAGGDLTRILCGSEGTLGLILSAELSTVPLPTQKGVGLFFFDSVAEAMQATVEFLDLKPAAIEHIDRALFEQTRGQLAFAPARKLLRLDEEPCEAILIVEFYDHVAEKLAALESRKVGKRSMILTGAKDMATVWGLRKAGLSLLTGCKGPAKPIAGIEDVAVLPEQLPDYVAGLMAIMKPLGLSASFYGHAAAGLLHVRPIVDLHKAGDIARYRQLTDEVSALTLQFKGSLAAEHGVGIARTEYMEEHIGPELLGAMTEIKRLFDPKGLLNPGKIFSDGRYAIDTNLRQGDGHSIELPFDPVLAFAAKDESFVGNLEQCNGCGGCRKSEPTMCPTFLATGEESLSTRGRANLIRSALEGRFDGKDNPLLTKELNEGVSNCLACKACTRECPSNVNMTLLKAELLHARHRHTGLTLRERIVSDFDRVGSLASLTPRLSNFMTNLGVTKVFMEHVVGFTSKRPFPAFATQRFDKWFARRTAPTAGPRGKVYLWDDTSVRLMEPEIGIAAVKVLEAAGYEVALAKGHVCSGRPAFSVGRLDMAKRLGETNVRLFRERYPEGQIVFLEPSCYSMFTEDYRELGVAGAEEVAKRCVLFEEFVARLLEKEPDALRFREGARTVGIHAHCHSKALADPRAAERLAAAIPGCEAVYLDTGCCGMAGQFGQLKEKYELSVEVGKDLADKVNALPDGAAVVAGGTSCRHQVAHLTDARPRHIAEVLAEALA
jgi:FAD/FMN-containing dehydrogenase/Fe-S oxidoreductase